FERYLYYRVGENPAKVRELMTQFLSGQPITLIDGGDPQFAAGRGDTAMTLETIGKTYRDTNVILDPHTAVGVAVAHQNMLEGIPMVCLATAHPAKFASAIQQALGGDLAHHPTLDALKDLPVRKVVLKPELDIIEGYMKEQLTH
ncbi:MAG: hypothetical protein J6X55_04785, partial [Victivallales bacterium]|nr:hypothetical protein [Victivallales bacterium]